MNKKILSDLGDYLLAHCECRSDLNLKAAMALPLPA